MTRSLGIRLRRRREELSLTQDVVGRQVGRSKPWVIKVEQDRVDPRLSDLVNVARVLRMDLGELIGSNASSIAQSGVNHASAPAKLDDGDDVRRREFLKYASLLVGTG